MEGGRTPEQDYHEIDMLLDAIPSATSGNPSARQPLPADALSSPSCNFINLNNSQSVANGGRMPRFGGLVIDREHLTNGELNRASNNGYEAHGPRIEQGASNLPDEQSLTSAFGELSFKDRVMLKAATPYKLNQTPPGHILLNNTESPLGMDTLGMATQPLHPYMNGITARDQDNVRLSDFNGHELKKQRPEDSLRDFGDQLQGFPVYPGPMSPGMHTYQLLPRVAASGIDLSASPYQQQFYMDAQVPGGFMPSCPLGRSNVTCQNLEEKRYYRMYQQYLYQQQLQNGGTDLLQFGTSMNSTIRPLNGTQRQQYYENVCNENSYWHDSALCKGYNQLDLSVMSGNPCQNHPQTSSRKGEGYEFSYRQKAYSSNDLSEWRVLDNMRKQCFPEKILTRSDGVNSVRSLRSASIATNQSTSFAENNGRILSNGHGNNTSIRSNGSFRLDSQDFQGYSPDSSDAKSVEMKFNSVDEVMGRIYYLAKDQHGCRFLQRKFTKGSPEDVGKIFAEIIGHIVELMTDPFGNYLVQKLLEVCNEEQRLTILHAITGEAGVLSSISCNMHGTRAVQKVIETLQTTEQMSMIVSSLKPGIVSLMKDANGNHVAQRCLQYFPYELSEFLYDAAIAHCAEIANDRQGCCVLQKCVTYAEGDRKCRLMSEICSYSLVLADDPFGNYVLQFVLDQNIPWLTAAVLGKLEGNYGTLSRHKQSSNVVEKCLKHASEEDRAKIIQELINSPEFLQIVQNPFGNYVIQAALRRCKGALLSALVEALKPHVPVLRNNPFGKKVLSSASQKKWLM